MKNNYPERFSANVMSLLAVSLVIQCLALLDLFPISANSIGRHIFSTVEMSLVVFLIWQSYQTIRWSRSQTTLVQKTAKLCFYSVILCGTGDFINRNYFESYYQFDQVLKHSYLMLAGLVFLPGYLLILKANIDLTKTHISKSFFRASIFMGLIAGCGTYAINHNGAMRLFSNSMILFYGIAVSILAISTVWLIKTYGWLASHVVVIGIILGPTIADAIIGNFWIYRDYFPRVEHINWLVYFTSLAMTQYLPILANKAKLN